MNILKNVLSSKLHMIKKYFAFVVLVLIIAGCSSTYKQASEVVENKPNEYPVAQDSLLLAADLVWVDNPGVLVYESLINKIADSKFNAESVREIYALNNFSVLWDSRSGIQKAFGLLKASYLHGLKPKDYHLDIIDSLLTMQQSDSLFDIEKGKELDVALTCAMFNYAMHLFKGKTNPIDFHTTWNYASKNELSVIPILHQRIVDKQIASIETTFAPKSIHYWELKNALEEFYLQNDRSDAVDPIFYPGFINRRGDSNIYVLDLKKHLAKKGILKVDSVSATFDLETEQIIKYLQAKHGLSIDGLPGKQTYAILNWGKQEYIDVIMVNLERIRWYPDSLPETFLTVNIPEYSLYLVCQDVLLNQTRVVVGKTNQQTPVFQSNLDYLVFNPCWTIPNSIATKTILPRLKSDSTYLDKRNMFVAINGIEQDHSQIDFSVYSELNFPYKIYQRNAAGNALGKVKFMFDNAYSIYLHDTPSQSLFFKDYRALSHGCVRVQYAMNFAELLLHKCDNSAKPLNHYLSKGYPIKVYLNQSIPLYITYKTSAYNRLTQQVQYFNDVYHKDSELLHQLR